MNKSGESAKWRLSKKKWRVGDVIRHKEFGAIFVITNTNYYISLLGDTGYTITEDERVVNTSFEKIGESQKLNDLIEEMRQIENANKGKMLSADE